MIAAMEEPKVLFEDESMLAVDKPAGITVNKSDTTTGEKTLQDWVSERVGIRNYELGIKGNGKNREEDYTSKEYFQKVFLERAGTVHRLDKETSGILLIAKTVESFQELQRQFKERRVKKTYRALAHGEIKPTAGEINVPVGRLPWNRMSFGVIAGGREAVTKYKVISNFKFKIVPEKLSLVELYPETGRTHQIRVHLQYIHHPIVSDMLYAGRKTARTDRTYLSRVFLHASKIVFHHPKSGKQIILESPLSQNLQNFIHRYCEELVVR